MFLLLWRLVLSGLYVLALESSSPLPPQRPLAAAVCASVALSNAAASSESAPGYQRHPSLSSLREFSLCKWPNRRGQAWIRTSLSEGTAAQHLCDITEFLRGIPTGDISAAGCLGYRNSHFRLRHRAGGQTGRARRPASCTTASVWRRREGPEQAVMFSATWATCRHPQQGVAENARLADTKPDRLRATRSQPGLLMQQSLPTTDGDGLRWS